MSTSDHQLLVPLQGAGQALLYLDYDGVLSHENVLWHPKQGAYLDAPARYTLFQHARLLEKMLQPHTDILIVLSTTWVLRFGCAGAALRLPKGLRSRVVGATNDCEAADFAYMPRAEQVTADVLRRKPSRWLALDDDPIGWPDWSLPHLLLTDPYEGISPLPLQEELRRRLAQLASAQLPPPTSP